MTIKDYIKDLERLVIEKDKELLELNNVCSSYLRKYEKVCYERNSLEKQLEEAQKDIVELEEHDMLFHNQLAIEQLEKLKLLIEDDNSYDENYRISRYIILDYIDNQIKELKEKL